MLIKWVNAIKQIFDLNVKSENPNEIKICPRSKFLADTVVNSKLYAKVHQKHSYMAL